MYTGMNDLREYFGYTAKNLLASFSTDFLCLIISSSDPAEFYLQAYSAAAWCPDTDNPMQAVQGDFYRKDDLFVMNNMNNDNHNTMNKLVA